MATDTSFRGLNVASGTHPSAGWLNFDYLPQDGLQLRADVSRLPFPDATFGKVYVGHTLEHIPWEAVPEVLGEIRRVMTVGGRLAVVGPDIERALQLDVPRWLLDAILVDGPESGPGGHKWTATGLMTKVAVQTVFPGAAEVPVTAVDKPEWPNPTTAEWQCAVLASKTAP